MEDYGVVATAGSLRSSAAGAHVLPHRWTPEGVAVEAPFTGAHLLHLAVAGCVLNDVYREAERLGLDVDGVRVRAWGGFEPGTWRSTGIAYAVELDTGAAAEDRRALLAAVDAVAEIPRAVREGAPVARDTSS
jgi:uncharacterized OsmC-like protein